MARRSHTLEESLSTERERTLRFFRKTVSQILVGKAQDGLISYNVMWDILDELDEAVRLKELDRL